MSKNEFKNELKKPFVSWKVKLTDLFVPTLCSNRGCELKIIGEILESSLKNKLRSHCQPPDNKRFKTETCSI